MGKLGSMFDTMSSLGREAKKRRSRDSCSMGVVLVWRGVRGDACQG